MVVLFWGVYAVDRELVFPKMLDSFYPQYLNQQQVMMICVFNRVFVFVGVLHLIIRSIVTINRGFIMLFLFFAVVFKTLQCAF